MTDSLSTRRYRRLLGAAVAVALIVRLVFALGYWVDKPLTVDQVEYLLLADGIAEGRGIDYGTEQRRLMRSPGYPVFLAAVRSVAPGLDGVKVAQSLLGALSVLLIAAMARRFGGRRAAVAAAFLAALYPPLVFQPAYILSEVLYAALALGTALVLWRALERNDASARRHLALGGAMAGVTMLTRPEFLFFLGCFTLFMLARRRVLWTAITLGAVAITILPWPLYNVVVHERLIFMSSRGGPNFWMGNNALALGDGDVSSNPSMGLEYNRIIDSHPDLSAEDLERTFYREALRFVGEHPLQWAGLEARKAFYFLVPVGPSYQSRSGLYRAAQSVSWLALLGLGTLGLRHLRRTPGSLEILGSLVGSVVLTSLIFFPLARYRIPVLDPVLIVAVSMLVIRQRR